MTLDELITQLQELRADAPEYGPRDVKIEWTWMQASIEDVDAGTGRFGDRVIVIKADVDE
jgi:hypothetical protein